METLECQQCGVVGGAYKELRLGRLPPCLMVHVVREYYCPRMRRLKKRMGAITATEDLQLWGPEGAV